MFHCTKTCKYLLLNNLNCWAQEVSYFTVCALKASTRIDFDTICDVTNHARWPRLQEN